MKYLILCSVLILGCQEAPKSLSSAQKDQLKAEVTQQVVKVIDALKTNNLEDFKALVALDDSDFMFILGDQFYTGEAMTQMIGEVGPLIDKQEFETKKESYNVVSNDLVAYAWHGKNSIIMKDGTISKYDDYFSTWVFKRINNQWKIIYGHESVFVPEVEPFKEIVQ